MMLYPFRAAARLSIRLITYPKTYRPSTMWIENAVPMKLCEYKFEQKSAFSSKANNKPIMVDPKRVLNYDDMLKVIHQPEKVIIDVRNTDEVSSTGKIPSSINIPLVNVQNVLTSMSEEDFIKHFNRSKPSSSDELIFYCRSGKRSSEALDKALKLGYSKSKTYLGSWDEWSMRRK